MTTSDNQQQASRGAADLAALTSLHAQPPIQPRPFLQRALRVLVALDIFVFAVITLGDARRDETISAAAWDMECKDKRLGKIFRPLIDWLFSPFQRDHCRLAWIIENPLLGKARDE